MAKADWVKNIGVEHFVLPSLPNYVSLVFDPVTGHQTSMDVADLSPEQLRGLAIRWGNALVELSGRRLGQRERDARGRA